MSFWCFLYLVLLLLAPPMLQDLPFVARGMKVDQLLVYVSLVMLLLSTRRMWVAKDGRLWLGLAAIYAATGWLTTLLTPWFYNDVNVPTGLVSALGSSRPFLIGLTVALLHSKFTRMNRDSSVCRQRILKFLAAVFALVGVIPLLVGILQYLGVPWVVDLTARYYGRARSLTDPASFRIRVYGTFDGQPNSFGTYAAVYALMLGGFVAGGVRGASTWIYSLLSAIGLIGCILSGSRGAYAALFAGAFMLLILLRPTLLRIVSYMGSAGALTAAAYLLVRPSTRERLWMLLRWTGYGSREPLADRISYWVENLAIWGRSPVFGGRGIKSPPPDNLVVGLLVTGGLLGLISFGLFLGISLIALVHRYRQQDSWVRIWAADMIAVTILLLVNGLSVPSFFMERTGDLYWFLLSTFISPARLQEEGLGSVTQTTGTPHIT